MTFIFFQKLLILHHHQMVILTNTNFQRCKLQLATLDQNPSPQLFFPAASCSLWHCNLRGSDRLSAATHFEAYDAPLV